MVLMDLFLLTIFYDSVKDDVHTALILNVSNATSSKSSIF